MSVIQRLERPLGPGVSRSGQGGAARTKASAGGQF